MTPPPPPPPPTANKNSRRNRRSRTEHCVVLTAAAAASMALITTSAGVDGFAPTVPSRSLNRRHLKFQSPNNHLQTHDVTSNYAATNSARSTSITPTSRFTTALSAMSREEYESQTVKMLRETVKTLGLDVKGLSKMKKADVVDVLMEAQGGAAVEDEEEFYEEIEEKVSAQEEVVSALEEATEELVEVVSAVEPELEPEPEPEPQPKPEPVSAAAPEKADAAPATPPAPIVDTLDLDKVESPGVATLREFLKYSEYGIAKATNERMRAEAVVADIDTGKRQMPDFYYEDFIEDKDDEDDDPNVIIVDEWGEWDERDLAGPRMTRDRIVGVDPDPNVLDPQFEYVTEIPKDDDGVEFGYNSVYGSYYPVDQRTVINPDESYIVDEKTANATSVPKIFVDDDDPEIEFNADIKTFRKSLKIVETYIDEYTGLDHPTYVAQWHGTPPLETYPEKDFMNNRFTEPGTKTDFSNLTPYEARKKAVELARSKNNEWLPKGVSAAYHDAKTQIYLDKGVLAGSFIEGEKDPEVVEQIQPALDVLGACADLLSIQDTVFRFHYHGLIKNKRGMAAWTETLIRDCGVECTGVVFETGTRKRDPKMDTPDLWHGPY